MNETFRSAFRPAFGFTARTGVVLLVVFGVVRVALVLQANVTGSYQVVGAVFALMIVLPFVLLTREGRRTIGLVRPTRWRWLLPAVAAGLASALLVHVVFSALWGFGTENPFAYIARSYSAVPSPVGDQRLMFFLIFAVIGVTFSPVGEEILYRGLAHESFVPRLGNRGAALLDAAAFALVHLAHFGIVHVAGAWTFLPLPAGLWFAAMFLASLMFYGFRRLSGSLTGAIAAHAGFNLGMTALIFFAILP